MTVNRTGDDDTAAAANPFAPPQAAVADVAEVPASGGPASQPLYYPTTALKIVVLNLATLGLYQLYWFYMNWKLHRQRTGEVVQPFLRTCFAILFCFGLFRRIDATSREFGGAGFSVGLLAAGWIIPSLTWRLPDPWWLMGMLAMLALLPVQRCINALNVAQAPAHDRNEKFTRWNWAAALVGLPFLGLSLVGLMMEGA